MDIYFGLTVIDFRFINLSNASIDRFGVLKYFLNCQNSIRIDLSEFYIMRKVLTFLRFQIKCMRLEIGIILRFTNLAKSRKIPIHAEPKQAFSYLCIIKMFFLQ